jgi:hypothetical protein
MADDDRADDFDGRRASRLEVEPLDDVTRRRLVATALRASEARPSRPSRAWRWLAAAAVVLVVAGVGFAVLRSGSGSDDQTASRSEAVSLAPEATAAARQVGDYGDLDDAANLAALRAALDDESAGASTAAPRAAGDSAQAAGASPAAGSTATTAPASLCGLVDHGGTIVALGTGTIDGRRATVALVEGADGTRTFEAVLESPCEIRALP